MADADALREPASGVITTEPPPPASGGSGMPDDSIMSLVDHLTELRDRLIRCVLAIAVGAVIGFYFATPVRDFLLAPLPNGEAQVLGPGDGFAIQLRIAVVIGIILAMPVLLYQVWAFVAPGLTPAERRAVRPWIPLALLFFALGVGIARLVLPYAVAFLLSFTDDRLVANIAAGPYFDFVTTMFLAFGLVLEFPILLVGLSRVGIVTSERLRSIRRYVLLGIAIILLIFPWVSQSTRNHIKHRWSRTLIALSGARLIVSGQPIDDRLRCTGIAPHALGPLVLANHISWMDIFAINAVMPARFVAKSEIRKWPLLGTLVTGGGTLYIERGRRHAEREVQECARGADHGPTLHLRHPRHGKGQEPGHQECDAGRERDGTDQHADGTGQKTQDGQANGAEGQRTTRQARRPDLVGQLGEDEPKSDHQPGI